MSDLHPSAHSQRQIVVLSAEEESSYRALCLEIYSIRAKMDEITAVIAELSHMKSKHEKEIEERCSARIAQILEHKEQAFSALSANCATTKNELLSQWATLDELLSKSMRAREDTHELIHACDRFTRGTSVVDLCSNVLEESRSECNKEIPKSLNFKFEIPPVNTSLTTELQMGETVLEFQKIQGSLVTFCDGKFSLQGSYGIFLNVHAKRRLKVTGFKFGTYFARETFEIKAYFLQRECEVEDALDGKRWKVVYDGTRVDTKSLYRSRAHEDLDRCRFDEPILMESGEIYGLYIHTSSASNRLAFQKISEAILEDEAVSLAPLRYSGSPTPFESLHDGSCVLAGALEYEYNE